MLVKGYVAEVVISCGAEVIARHPRSYGDDFPIHSLEQKTAALDQAAPLHWQLPEEFATLRGTEGQAGIRAGAATSGKFLPPGSPVRLRLGAISFDAVKHLLLCHLEGRPPRLDLDLYPYLPRVSVKTTSATPGPPR